MKTNKSWTSHINHITSHQNTNFVYILYSEKKMKFEIYADSEREVFEDLVKNLSKNWILHDH